MKNNNTITASEEEQARRLAEGRTQGRAGCHAPRINLALTSSNHDFVRIMSRATGQSMTKFVNYCVEHYRIQHQEFFLEAQDFIRRLEADDELTDEPADEPADESADESGGEA